MVNTEIPKHYTISPSSFSVSGTPQLTINRDIQDLDSSNAFEGPEKLLEVWFSASAQSLPACSAPLGLKAVSAEVWKDMLDLVNCKVLSTIESEAMDAYLLSESSMFVFPHKLILKTCGTTTLLCGLPRILEIAATYASFPNSTANVNGGQSIAATPYRVFYSRKNFLFPDRQRGPHRSWRNEVKTLDKLFLGGSAYMIGKMNGEHWYLYLTEPNTILTPPSTPDRAETQTRPLNLPEADSSLEFATTGMDTEDETLEILMTDLDEETAKQFHLDHASAVAEGRYFQRAHKARQEAQQALGSIDEGAEYKNEPPRGSAANIADVFDVFGGGMNDNGERPQDETDGFPQELNAEGHALGTVVSETCGLSDIYPTSGYPDARVDAYLFNPCGFSANGVIPAMGAPKAGHYFTVHVTPEPQCSYASFETNVPFTQAGRDTVEVVQQVVSIFKPGRFSVTLFETKPQAGEGEQETAADKLESESRREVRRKRSGGMENIRGYRRVDRIVHDLDGYELVFRYYERWDWQGGAPRLGEF